jgi:hypothetical protein
MSTMYEVTTFEFHNRKPSEAQVVACIKNAIEQGQYALDVHWGENCLTFDYQPARKHLEGRGWIKNMSGDFIAKEFTAKLNRGEAV